MFRKLSTAPDKTKSAPLNLKDIGAAMVELAVVLMVFAIVIVSLIAYLEKYNVADREAQKVLAQRAVEAGNFTPTNVLDPVGFPSPMSSDPLNKSLALIAGEAIRSVSGDTTVVNTLACLVRVTSCGIAADHSDATYEVIYGKCSKADESQVNKNWSQLPEEVKDSIENKVFLAGCTEGKMLTVAYDVNNPGVVQAAAAHTSAEGGTAPLDIDNVLAAAASFPPDSDGDTATKFYNN